MCKMHSSQVVLGYLPPPEDSALTGKGRVTNRTSFWPSAVDYARRSGEAIPFFRRRETSSKIQFL